MSALRSRDPNTGGLPTRMIVKASRFAARQFRRKTLNLRHVPPMVTFTFDDVPVSACETGASILERYGARGTFYVAGGGCGTSDHLGPPRASIEHLRTICRNGHEIGCHTYSHPAVRYINSEELGVELDQNKSFLQKIDKDIAIRNFAYPYGDMSIRTKRNLEERFDSCRSCYAGINSSIADLGALKAWPLEDASLDRAGVVELITRTARSGGWLIFYSHDVAERPSRYGVSPDLLEAALKSARESACVIDTIAGCLSRAGSLTAREAGSLRETPR